jgi:hypothetical protein
MYLFMKQSCFFKIPYFLLSNFDTHTHREREREARRSDQDDDALVASLVVFKKPSSRLMIGIF